MINKKIAKEVAYEYRFLSSEEKKEVKKRNTGRSTALALEYISKAMQNKNNWIVIKDHHDSKFTNHLLKLKIKDFIKKLELTNFRFENNKIKFVLNVENIYKGLL